ncbi:ATP-binding protein (plasmid) [Burkholderia sp. MS455]|uniref:ATP-binding protein n=1 Tax=Burkholderia sp. MS455 TaxID=2811788 RepID=UPI00195B131F|nr:ATP-binding protein [Burkholderia sp. MS455]QRR11849.1 ATP-binding protein [Burkholderia sp. MS455]
MKTPLIESTGGAAAGEHPSPTKARRTRRARETALPPPAPTANAPVEGDALAALGPWLEYVDHVMQGMLLWQQQHAEDRFNMQGLLQPPETFEATRTQLQGAPYWIRQPARVLWLEGLQRPPARGRLAEMVERFALTPFETLVLVLCALPLFEPRYGPLVAYLQGDDSASWPGIELALALFSATPAERIAHRQLLCAQAGTLLREGLLHTVERNGRFSTRGDAYYLRMDDAVFHFLSGGAASTLRTGLGEAAQWWQTTTFSPLRAGAWAPYADEIARACFVPNPHGARTPLLMLQGGHGREALLGQLADEAGVPMLVLDLGQLPQEEQDAWGLLRATLLAARLYAGVLVLRRWSAGLTRHRALLEALEPYLADHGQPVVCLVSAEEAGDVLAGLPRLCVTLPPRTTQDDAQLLQDSLGADALEGDWDWVRLLRRTRVNPDVLAQTWREAQGYRALRDPQAALTQRDLQQALRVRGQQHFGTLAQRVQPRRTFDDLIIGDGLGENLREILAAIRQREAVLDRGFARKVGYGTGISALFYGESGTGKSMAAEVLAGELGLDLIRVDLSTVVNKYIGETEKNLSKIFDLAVADTGVLLFDEADALFGKRSEVKDAHDRHANIEVSYLLQRLEQYPGLVVLTTNNRSHLDDAFTRRLTFITRFDSPDQTLRERMWREIWPKQVSVDDSVDWAQWASATTLTGAGIRNVALLASWLAAEEAREVTHADIERAVRRELGKTGRIMPTLEQ